MAGIPGRLACPTRRRPAVTPRKMLSHRRETRINLGGPGRLRLRVKTTTCLVDSGPPRLTGVVVQKLNEAVSPDGQQRLAIGQHPLSLARRIGSCQTPNCHRSRPPPRLSCRPTGRRRYAPTAHAPALPAYSAEATGRPCSNGRCRRVVTVDSTTPPSAGTPEPAPYGCRHSQVAALVRQGSERRGRPRPPVANRGERSRTGSSRLGKRWGQPLKSSNLSSSAPLTSATPAGTAPAGRRWCRRLVRPRRHGTALVRASTALTPTLSRSNPAPAMLEMFELHVHHPQGGCGDRDAD
jgi:hypothetical protein